jgi:hypothetical protein
MRRIALLLFVAALVACGCGDDPEPVAAAKNASVAPGPCRPATVHQPPYPGDGQGLDGLPWVAGTPRGPGLVGLVWFWAPEWENVRRARIWAGGKAPQGYNTKMLWVFLGRDARDKAGSELRVRGRRMDGPGRFSDSFASIGYAGSDGNPSYASIIDIPKPGCWRLTLTSGSLRATVDMRAIPGPGSS